MHGKVTDQEWEIFRQAYLFFSEHCDPPANQDEAAVLWWQQTAIDVASLDNQWKERNLLMRSLLVAIYEYLEYKAQEKNMEVADFV